VNAGIISGIIVAVASFLTAVVLVLKARPEARKLKSDGTAALLTATSATGAELADQVAELQSETRKIWRAQREQEARINEHIRWDKKVVEAVRDLGGTIAEPPPLYQEATQET
jgi:uncharacterized protein YoxC